LTEVAFDRLLRRLSEADVELVPIGTRDLADLEDLDAAAS
jgi:hypothetical protein